MNAEQGSAHRWSFFRAGGFDQVRIAKGADIVALGELDQKLWVALACPTKGLEFDQRTLELVDTTKDGRIRASELIAACRWTGRVLKNADDLLKGSSELPLSSINDGVEEGKRLLAGARSVLESLGKSSASSLPVAEATDAVQALNQLKFNGDGVVPPESASDDAVRAVLLDAITATGGSDDRSGKKGVTIEQVDQFFKELAAYAEWLDKADPEASPLGDDTAAAFAVFQKVRVKVDDYFARSRLAAFDARATQALNREEKDYLPIAAKDLKPSVEELVSFPLARVEAQRPLPLLAGVNPAWIQAISELRSQVVTPLLGEKSELTEEEWIGIGQRFAGFEKWQASKVGASVEPLGPGRVREILSGPTRPGIDALFAEEKSQEPIAQSLTDLERLVRYHRDLFKLVNNFVAFSDFYGRKDHAMFQAGTLYLDQRSCELCIRVEDAGKHAAMAPLSRAFLVYCDCVRQSTNEKMSIVAAMTAGDSDNLMVGRNGIFYDRKGNDWDATVTKIVDNPISVRQAFWSPYKKLIRFIEAQFAKRAASAEAASGEKLTASATELEKSATTGKAGVPPKKFDVGTVAALGVAVGGITAAFGALIEAFFGLGFWMPIGLVGLLLAISGPSMAIAALKLRQRNLGPILDANGWALNAPARLNIPFGGSLTKLAVLPPGSARDLADPFAERRPPWAVYGALVILLALALSWVLGNLDPILPEAVRSKQVFGKEIAPAAPAGGEKAPSP